MEEIKQYLIHFYNAVDVEDDIKVYIFNTLKIEWLIEQAKRVWELEKENRRYRKVINNINEKAMLYGVDEQVFETIKEAIRILEGHE